MGRKSAVPDNCTDALCAELMLEEVIWKESDPNHENLYQRWLAFERVGSKLGCTGLAVEKKYKELLKSRKLELRNEPILTSGSAGVVVQNSWTEARQIDFVKDGRKPSNPHCSGNVVKNTSSNVETTSSEPVPDGNTSTVVSRSEVAADHFIACLVDDMSPLNDEEKLRLRIKMYKLLYTTVKESK